MELFIFPPYWADLYWAVLSRGFLYCILNTDELYLNWYYFPSTNWWKIQLSYTALHTIELYCTGHSTKLYLTVNNCTVLHCTLLNFTGLYCTLHCTAHCFLRSWVHKIVMLFRTFSPRLEDNEKLKLSSEIFHNDQISQALCKIVRT